jgi:hypothetical protein
MRYVWLVEGEPFAGALQDYADDVESAIYSDLAVSRHVWYSWSDGLRRALPTVMSRSSHDDVETIVISVGGDEARYKIDLRA